MDNNLSQKAKDYGVFDAYVIWYVRNIVDQRLWALVVPHFLAQLTAINLCAHICAIYIYIELA